MVDSVEYIAVTHLTWPFSLMFRSHTTADAAMMMRATVRYPASEQRRRSIR